MHAIGSHGTSAEVTGAQGSAAARRASVDEPRTGVTVLLVHAPKTWRSEALVASAKGRHYHFVQAAPASAEELWAVTHHHAPRLGVIGVDTCQALGMRHLPTEAQTWPGCQWLLSWGAPQREWTQTLIDVRANGCLEWGDSLADLARGFDAVLDGELWFPRRVMQWIQEHLIEALPGASAPGASVETLGAEFLGLTPREAEVFSAMRRGLTNKEIGLQLGISVGTVKKHLAIVFTKRGMRHRRQSHD